MGTGVEIALIAAAGTSVAASGYSIVSAQQSAQAQGDFANYNAAMQNQALQEQQALAAISASEQEVQRMREYRRLRAANEAIISASGVGQNMSFLQGADAFARRLMEEDLAAIRLNEATGRSRIASQIAVNRAQASFTGSMAQIQANEAAVRGIAGAASAVGNYYYQSGRLATPRPPASIMEGVR